MEDGEEQENSQTLRHGTKQDFSAVTQNTVTILFNPFFWADEETVMGMRSLDAKQAQGI